MQPGQGDGMTGGMQDLMRMAQTMREQLMATQVAMAERVVTGTAGGAVAIAMTAAGEFRSVSIDPSVIDPAEPERLEGLVLAALRDATSAVQELSEERFASIADGMNAFRPS